MYYYVIKMTVKFMQGAKEKGKSPAPKLLLGGAELAVMFFPVVFLTIPLLQLTEGEALTAAVCVLPQVIAAVLGCFAAVDRSAREAMLKWIVSLPFSAAFWLYFVNSGFLLRMNNYINPGYGEGATGDGLGIILVLGAAVFAGAMGVAAGMYFSHYTPSERFRKTALLMQKTVCPVICAIIFITVIILEIIIPGYSPIPG